MITVACVEQGNYLGRGAEYVQVLKASVARHLAQPHRFVCLSDRDHAGVECVPLEGGLSGWWAKLNLFRPGLFEGRVLYLDLDTIVVGALDRLADSKGILHLDRWGWDRKVYGSGVMCWDAGEYADVWTARRDTLPQEFEGDQDWITALGGWPALPDGLAVSYRYHCLRGVPAGAAVVCCHGTPKPHQITLGWAVEAWRA